MDTTIKAAPQKNSALAAAQAIWRGPPIDAPHDLGANQSLDVFVEFSDPPHHALGVVAGLFSDLSTKLSLLPLARAFLPGYGVEAVFSMFDGFIAKFKKVDQAKRPMRLA